MAQDDLLAEISEKLDRVVALLAIQGKDQATQFKILDSLGYGSSFIGAVMGVPASTVRNWSSGGAVGSRSSRRKSPQTPKK